MDKSLILQIASQEVAKNGEISKGTRINIAEMAVSGESFTLQCSTKDYLRIYNLLKRKGENKRMSSVSEGNKYFIKFN